MAGFRLEDLEMFAKADKRPAWKKKGWVGPGGAWETAKRKAKEQGKPESYARAIYQKMCHKSEGASLPYLGEYLEKAGFGSHGGRVIGFTRSSKPIYQSGQLHGTALLHQRQDAKGRGAQHATQAHSQHFQGHSQADHHDAAAAHTKAASGATSQDAANHHTRMAAMHTSMASHAGSSRPTARMAA